MPTEGASWSHLQLNIYSTACCTGEPKDDNKCRRGDSGTALTVQCTLNMEMCGEGGDGTQRTRGLWLDVQKRRTVCILYCSFTRSCRESYEEPPKIKSKKGSKRERRKNKCGRMVESWREGCQQERCVGERSVRQGDTGVADCDQKRGIGNRLKARLLTEMCVTWRLVSPRVRVLNTDWRCCWDNCHIPDASFDIYYEV